MGRGTSKAGGGSGAYNSFLKMSDTAKDDFVLNAVNNTKVPDGVKDTPTMRVLVALGMNNKPNMVDDKALDSMKGEEYFRTVTDEFNYMTGTKGKNSKDIVKEFTKSDFSSMSDQNGSSEGRGYYFAKDLKDATFWSMGQDTALTMRAKVQPSAKMANVDDLLNNGKSKIRQDYVGDKHFHDSMKQLNGQPWDKVSIWLIKKGYKGAHATDSGTGAKEVVMFDRGALNVSKKVGKIPKKTDYTWKDM